MGLGSSDWQGVHHSLSALHCRPFLIITIITIVLFTDTCLTHLFYSWTLFNSVLFTDSVELGCSIHELWWTWLFYSRTLMNLVVLFTNSDELCCFIHELLWTWLFYSRTLMSSVVLFTSSGELGCSIHELWWTRLFYSRTLVNSVVLFANSGELGCSIHELWWTRLFTQI